jgi:catechol 2,3-dioxygenase-like lactoylglutathione lyase family enzyme
MLTESELIAFVSTTDLPRARAFYSDVLGLRLVETNPYACVMEANGTMLRITAVAELAPPPQTVLGWRVTDIAATIHTLAARGVVFTRYDGMDQDDAGVWTTPAGDKVAWFADPDQNTLSLTQFSAS